ncbi:glucose-6-phosphate isomerase [Achromobacter pulmonis]|uniref:Glucose-6-phosphate isomerase n=1 Tax=Achromobacter pulmonis TaxID=1389932 RepID=A0A2N8KLR5_9BURK|nr:glucose-6-phosphate isomerase [Achromobacter pulmonis]MBO9328862.1 glucose-6-phosphate isomerase [Achromobacter xylosoxidans]PND34396.1 glucose-6-phosphate isomerase [Achromobacter pulmonis]
MGKANNAIEASRADSGLADSPEWRGFAQAAQSAALDAGALKVIEAAGLCVDLTMQRQSPALDAAAQSLLQARGLAEARRALFAGEPVNWTEGKPAWHTALRAGRTREQPDGQDADSVCEYARMMDFVRRVDQTADFSTVLHIGIGGSDWGPRLAIQAFGGASQRRQIRFVSNIDGHAFHDAVAGLDPRRCLVVVSSKSFTTAETLHNARAAIAWLKQGGAADVSEQLAAVTANPSAARALGVPASQVFKMCDWVGGRYSVWSVAGLSIALTVGAEVLIGMQAGAQAMDQHFQQAPFGSNAPVQLALAGLVNCSVLGHNSLNIAAYSARLLHLVTYLQQLEMESLGKRVAGDGAAVGVPTAPIIWGMPGTDGQHTFFQWLHQSEAGAPVDFIASLQGHADSPDAHRKLLANCLAQRQALLRGKSLEQALLDVAHIDDREHALTLAQHMVHPGGRPSTLIVLRQLDPRGLGALLALYEHKVFVQSVVWGINPFDQWGVELGKRLATGIERELAVPVSAGVVDWGHDASTSYWIDRYRSHAQAPRPRHAWVPGVAAHL